MKAKVEIFRTESLILSVEFEKYRERPHDRRQ